MTDAAAPTPSFSIALETANLDIAGVDDLRACIASLERQTPSAAQANEVVLVNDGRVDDVAVHDLLQRHPWLHVRHDPTADYVAMKLDAAATMTGDVVLLCDSDVVYDAGWLSAMLEPFSDPDVHVVAGETSTPIRGPYSLAIAMTFIFPRFTGDTGVRDASVYWANNVAFRRSTLLALPPRRDLPLYRGQTIVHSVALDREGVRMVRNPAARGWHVIPSLRDLPLRYYRLGRDAALVRRLARTADGRAYDGAFPPDRGSDSPLHKVVRRTVSALAERPLRVILLPLAVPVAAGAGILWIAGRLAASRTPGASSPHVPR